MALANPFIWGRGGAAMTPAEIARRREIENAILSQGVETGPVGHWLEGLARIGNAAAGAFRRGQLDAADEKARGLGTEGFNKIVDALRAQQGVTSSVPMTDAAAEVSATAPTGGQPIDMTGNEVYSGFIDTVKDGGLTNPYGLAAVSATGKAESGWSPENVNRRWSDPSESGQAGTAGAIMSWRGDRLRNLENFAAERGEDPSNISPQTQAAFFLQEDPGLIEKLNGAKSVEEAQSLMNNAWRFAGYNRPGGEAANRLGYATSYLPTFQGQGGAEVASLDPNAGMADGAIVPGAEPIVSSSLADEVADYEGSQEYADRFGNTTGQPLPDNEFDKRFGDTPLPVEQLTGRDAVAQALIDQQQRANGGQQAITTQTAGIPATGQAVQDDGIMQAVNGTNAGGSFGLNPLQEEATRQYAQANLLQDPAFLEALNNPYLSDQQRAIAQTLVEQQLKQQAMEREYRLKQADPSYQLGLKKTRLEIENMENPRETPADKLARERFDYERGTADRTADVKNYEYYAAQERAAGREPLGMLDWDTAQRKAGATSVNVGEGDKFYENLDRKNAETFAAMSDAGIQARGRMAQINRLETLFANVPQGIEGGFKKLAGDYGIALGDGTSDIQAASALIEKMVPEQRPPGSGPMSDADIAMFRSSLPRVLNQPGGNELIFGTMRGIAQYEAEMGAIADRVADRDITPAEGRRLIRELKNPLEDFKIPDGSTPNEGMKTRTGRTWKRVE